MGESKSYKFCIVDPTNLRGFRVEATKASLFAVLPTSQMILKEVESGKAQAKKAGPKSWMAKREDSGSAGGTAASPVGGLEGRMVPLHGQVSWSPSRKAWAIYYKEKPGKDADRKQKWFSVQTKDDRFKCNL